jgi:hypothetical protein
MPHTATGLDGIYETTQATESGHEIWNTECYKFLQDRNTENSSNWTGIKHNLDLVTIQEVSWVRVVVRLQTVIHFSMKNENANHHIGTSFSVHK